MKQLLGGIILFWASLFCSGEMLAQNTQAVDTFYLLAQQEVKQKEMEIVQLKQAQAQQKQAFWLSLGGMTLLFVLALMLWRQNQMVRKRNRLLFAQNHSINHLNSGLEKKYEAVKEKMAHLEKLTSHMLLKSSAINVPLNDIEYIEASGKYVLIYLTDQQEPITERSSFGELLDKLPNQSFVQVQRSFAVNVNYIDKRPSKYLLVMKSGTDIKVSRNHVNNLMDRFSLS